MQPLFQSGCPSTGTQVVSRRFITTAEHVAPSRSPRAILRTAAAVLMCVVTIGCGGAERKPISGTITVDGKPAAGAVLLFHPDSGTTGSVGSAVAGDDGVFNIVSDMNPGLAPGSYRVTISWPDPNVKPSERAIMLGTAEPGPDLLKGKYVSKSASNLTVQVDASSDQLPPIELASP